MTRAGAVGLMLAAPVLWSTAGVVTRHVEKAGAFEQVFWRSAFAFAFVFAFLLIKGKNPLREIQKAKKPGMLSGKSTSSMRYCRLACSPRTCSCPNESCATPGKRRMV